MKNKYFGDVNDYRKYGVLRALIEASCLNVGVCWMLTADDGRTDGEFRRYLDDERRWRHHDPDLYNALRKLRNSEVKRDVRLADEWNLLPGASYFDSLVPDSRHGRAAYFAAAMNALSHTPVVFFDPDNGFEVKSVPVGAKDSSKYLLWTEVEEAYSRGHSVVVYQHFPRQPRAAFIEAVACRLHERLGASLVESYTTAHVVFFLASRPQHADRLAAVRELVAQRWSGQIGVGCHAIA